MHSSPSADDDDEMFPDEALPNNPSTPHPRAPADLLAADLSPPNSQPQAQAHARDPSTLTTGVNANGKRPLSHAQTAAAAAASVLTADATHHDPDTGYEWSRNEDQPGFDWKNNRAREDEARALDAILDLGRQMKSTLWPFTHGGGGTQPCMLANLCACSTIRRSARCDCAC